MCLDQDRLGFFKTLQLGERIAVAAEEDADQPMPACPCGQWPRASRGGGKRIGVLGQPGIRVSEMV
ncbi:MAG: hypothetical protein ACYTAS_18220 [Planctomycetota bacterium]